MTNEQRKITEEQIAKFEAALADPWRSLRAIEKGVDPIFIRAEEDAMRSQIETLRSELANT